ncbi:MAG: EF-P lysine aminoacylase EpmA [Planctomycetota bacterium]
MRSTRSKNILLDGKRSLNRQRRTGDSVASRLRARAKLLRQIRSHFDGLGFCEVQPSCLADECIVDPYIDPVEVSTAVLGGPTSAGESKRDSCRYLQTSPEWWMKLQLARGAPSLYGIGPVFRAGEHGSHHRVEFTMLEWYEMTATMSDGMATLGTFAVQILGGSSFDAISYRQLFLDHLDLDPIELPTQQLVTRVEREDPALAQSLAQDRDGLLDVLLSRLIQPNLGQERPLVVFGYPLSQAALARPLDDDPNCAARFELFVRGVELGNGYDELTDADELQRRHETANAKRVASGRSPLPEPTRLIQAMKSGLPACAGVAVGVDRLLMVRQQANDLSDVLTEWS